MGIIDRTINAHATLTTVLRRERSANGQITAMQLRLSSKNADYAIRVNRDVHNGLKKIQYERTSFKD